MAEEISSRLREEFHQAIGAYENWKRNGGPEPEIPMQRESGERYPASISSVCELVQSFEDTMPDQWHEMIVRMAARVSGGKYVPQDQSYRSGAKSLKGLIDYNLEQERRRALEFRWSK